MVWRRELARNVRLWEWLVLRERLESAGMRAACGFERGLSDLNMPAGFR